MCVCKCVQVCGILKPGHRIPLIHKEGRAAGVSPAEPMGEELRAGKYFLQSCVRWRERAGELGRGRRGALMAGPLCCHGNGSAEKIVLGGC